jgi:hypothetical protein
LDEQRAGEEERPVEFVNRRGTGDDGQGEQEVFSFQNLKKRTSFLRAKAVSMYTRSDTCILLLLI